MKKVIFTAALAISALTVNAQTPPPTIYSQNSSLSSLRTVTMAGNNLTFKPTTGTGLFINGSNGSIGINTSSPSATLDVNGNLLSKTGHFSNAVEGFTPTTPVSFSTYELRNKSCQVLTGGKLLDANGTRTLTYFDFPVSNLDVAPTVHLEISDRAFVGRLRFNAVQGKNSTFVLSDKNQIANFEIKDDGNDNISLALPKTNSRVGIGTTSFTDGTDLYALSVNGNVRADRVKVYTTWADYVFEEDYKLPTLEEVEKHIKEKGHLQDIPSAAEVEEKGIELGEMNKLLLQKIEELTLYTIELNKQVQELKRQINKQ